MTNTIQYYDLNQIEEYTEKTINTNMTKTYNMFEKYLKPNDHILDLGCGSGRDTKHFITNYHVTALDPVKAFLNNVPENINKLNLNATDMRNSIIALMQSLPVPHCSIFLKKT